MIHSSTATSAMSGIWRSVKMVNGYEDENGSDTHGQSLEGSPEYIAHNEASIDGVSPPPVQDGQVVGESAPHVNQFESVPPPPVQDGQIVGESAPYVNQLEGVPPPPAQDGQVVGEPAPYVNQFEGAPPMPAQDGQFTQEPAPYENRFENAYAQYGDEWRDPAYSATSETTSGMYTPGIYFEQPVPRRRAPENESEHKRHRRKGRVGSFLRAVCLVIVCALFSGASAYVVMEYRFNRGDFNTVNQVVLGNPSVGGQQVHTVTSPVATTGAGMAAEDIYDIACSQVVSVNTEMPNSTNLFGDVIQGSTTAVSGSGFIISSDGYILTNYHVVQTAHQNNLPLVVCLHDGSEYDATVVGYEALSDVALIKIDATGLNAAVIANSDNIRVGQRVFAVGNPFGDWVYTMTDGIISALDRVVTVERKNINTFQFSAAVNPGNSGGPVYDTNGEVIGIVSVKITGSSVEGIGFAIPINDAILIASELIEHGYITGRAFMGITAETVNRAHAEYYGFVEGAYVRSVSEGSAAETAGILFGDIIIQLGSDEITTQESLVYALRKFRAGDTTTLIVWRGGKEVELTITFDENMTAGQP